MTAPALPPSSKEKPTLSRVDGWIAAALGLLALAVYTRTLVPGLLPGDGGEFQALAYTLDHAHTTGYPVYLALAKMFTWLPVGDVAYRVNLFSAAMAGLTVAFTYLAGQTLSGCRWGAGLAAAALAVSSVFWSQAVIAEVYTAGSAFTAAILWLALYWQVTRRPRLLFVAGVLGGLGLGVHGTVALAAPGVLILLWLERKDLRAFWKPALAGALAGLLLCLAAFALIDSRPSNASMINTYSAWSDRWGLAPDQIDSPVERLEFLALARQWRSAMFSGEDWVFTQNFGKWFSFFQGDFAFVVRLLVVAGFASLMLRRWNLAMFFAVGLSSHLLYTLNYGIGDIYVFFISLYVPILALAAEGMGWLFSLFERLPDALARFPRLLRLLAGAALIVLTVLPYAGARADALRAGEIRFDFMGLPSNEELADWRAIIQANTAALPENALLLAGWNDLYAYIYTAQVELERGDILCIEAHPYSIQSEPSQTILNFVESQLKQGRPVLSLDRHEDLSRAGFRLARVSVGYSEMYEIQQP